MSAKYKPWKGWAVMAGDQMVRMLYETRDEARGLLATHKRLHDVKPQWYAMPARVVRVTVQIEEKVKP